MNVPTYIEEALVRDVRGFATEHEQEVVASWRAESIANDEYYRELKWLATLAADATPAVASTPPSAAQLIEEAERRVRTQPAAGGQASGRGWPRRALLSAAAAVILVVGAGVILPSIRSNDQVAEMERVEHRTGPGEQRTVRLEDGTLVHLAASTTLQVYGDPAAPRMWLAGRAFFGVPKKEDRRIVIETSAGTVTVLGTRFDLRSLNGDLQLMVLDGRVSVAAGEEEAGVGSGELGLVNAGDLEAVVRVEDPFSYLAWMESAMVFQATPFSRAAEEIAARYGVQFDIRDADVGSRTVTTSFEGMALDEVLTVMCGVVNARCSIEGQTVTVTSL